MGAKAIVPLLVSFALSAPALEPELSGHAAALYRQAEGGKEFKRATKLKPDILPTTDGQSFYAVWKAQPQPGHWIVSLHGTHGFATDDLALWSPNLKNRDVGIICLQWWLGEGDDVTAYYTPEQIHREVDAALEKLGAKPGTVMLHGFSRGSANAYAVAALDAGKGRHFFSLNVASSGGVEENYPPTRAILDGAYGPQPLRGTRWITVAGGHDPNPDRSGVDGMRRTAEWLKAQGATVVDAIEDPDEGHGALMRNPANAWRVLDLFLGGD